MMWRFRIFLLFTTLVNDLNAQSKELPPPPPIQYDFAASKHCVLDEFMNPLDYYKPVDNVYFDIPDSIKKKQKLKSVFVYSVIADINSPVPERFYSWYNENGQLTASATYDPLTGDSSIVYWKYNIQ